MILIQLFQITELILLDFYDIRLTPRKDLEWSIDGIKATYKFKKNIRSFTKRLFIHRRVEPKIISKIKEKEKETYNLIQRTIIGYTDDIKTIGLILL